MSAVRTAALIIVGLGAAVGGGWYSAVPMSDEAAALITPVRGGDAGLKLEKPNAGFASAAAALDQLGLAEPAEVAGPVAAAEAPPPEPDITAELRRDITAVLRERNGRALLVIDRDNNEERVKLRAGDAFRHGWKIEQITAQRVVLSRNGEKQVLPIMSMDAAEPEIPGEAGGQPPG